MTTMLRRSLIVSVIALLGCPVFPESIADQAPISYATAPVDDAIAQLQRDINSGKTKLPFDDKHGYLTAVLKALNIPASSQTLVFSKTSFQRDLIAPWKPRALYFNDDAYIGWVQDGEVLEVASVDKKQGPIFYTLSQQKADKPKFLRQTDSCLQCHESSMTQDVPGLMIRSVYPDASGLPMYSAGTFRTTEASPFTERWGGWYVTGTHGSARHMGNIVIRKKDDPDHLDLDRNANLTDLSSKLDVSPYLQKGSDIVALFVLTHQTQVHNLLTQCSYETRLAQRDQEAINKALGEKPDYVSDSMERRIQSACDPLVHAMFFCDAIPLPSKITGTSTFAKDFSSRGPKDLSGRSLRDFDLTKRVFKYPCSFLIYSESFRSLPALAKNYIYREMFDVLSGKDTRKDFANLTAEDKLAVRQILAATLSDLPDYWRK